jgi:hypothetical protein
MICSSAVATNFQLLIGALLLEGAAIATLLAGMQPDSTMALFFLIHLLASALLAFFVWPFFPAQYRQPRRYVLIFLGAFSFFVPVLAFFGLLFAAVASRFLSRLYTPKPFSLVKLPRVADSIVTISSSYGIGGIRSRLLSANSSTDMRMKALLAVNAIPGRLSSPLLREMLGDPVDDIRLVAYGMLDGQEKKLNAQINHAIEKLDQVQEPLLRLPYLKRLGELYWELVYQGLAQSDVMRFALGESLHYTNEALQINPADGDLWVLLGKVQQRSGQGEAAAAALCRAGELGIQDGRVLSYLAELAYSRRDFAEVRRLLRQANTTDAAQVIQPVAHFWCGAVAE